MANKLDRLRLELKKAREKRDEWAARTETLEQKVTEEENLQICDMVRSVSLTPEALAELLRQRTAEVFTKPANKKSSPKADLTGEKFVGRR